MTLPYHTHDPEPSRLAAKSHEGKAVSNRTKILAVLSLRDGCASGEIAKAERSITPHRVEPGRLEVRPNGSGFVCEYVSRANNGPTSVAECPWWAAFKVCRSMLARMAEVKA